MILRTSVKAVVYPDALTRKCSAAEKKVTIQAERDSRPYIPSNTGRLRGSGRVYGNTIVWNERYARLQYFGKVYVDPKRKIAGFLTPDGWRSFAGQKKIRTTRNFRHTSGGPLWFSRAKREHLTDWIKLAQGVIARG